MGWKSLKGSVEEQEIVIKINVVGEGFEGCIFNN